MKLVSVEDANLKEGDTVLFFWHRVYRKGTVIKVYRKRALVDFIEDRIHNFHRKTYIREIVILRDE